MTIPAGRGRAAFVFDIPGRVRTTVVFSPYRDVATDRLIEPVKLHFDRALPSDRVVTVSLDRDVARALAADERLNDFLTDVPYYSSPEVRHLYLGAGGDLHACAGGDAGDGPPEPAGEIDETLQRGMRHVFRSRGGFLDARDAYHYAKPSQRHSGRFIRAANVLINDVEIAFVALAVARLVRMATPPAIYVDTAGINAVAMWLRRILERGDGNPPGGSGQPIVIDSFSSYGGLDSDELDLALADDALFLISASTSGGLAEKLKDKVGADLQRVVTLFYGGAKATEGLVLCDLTEQRAGIGFEPVTSFPADDCDLCERGRLVVSIVGDQFLPAEPVVTDTIVKGEHRPPWFRETLPLLVGSGIVRCYGGRSKSSQRTREIYLDLRPSLASIAAEPINDFATMVRERLRHLLPAALAGVVAVDGGSSAIAAKAIASLHAELAGATDAAPVVTLGDLDVEEDLSGRTGVILVVASASVSGRSLLAAAQRLRAPSKDAPLLYVTCVNRPSKEATATAVANNLRVGRTGPVPHSVVDLCTAFLPDDLQRTPNPWDWELSVLDSVVEWQRLSGDGTESTGLVEARREKITAHGDNGFADSCFLPRVIATAQSLDDPRQRLVVRPGFVFWKGIEYEEHSQADAYLTMAAVLHWLRTGSTGEGNVLLAHDHNRAVLSPLTFARFNDGILQAALLRAALPFELDFRSSEQLSALMRDILLDVLSSPGDERGEAANEFLLALAGEKLRLRSDDEREIGEAITPERLDAYGSMLLRYWRRDAPGQA